LRAGAARADITPRGFEPIYLAGFGMGRRATGVHAPLIATALAIDTDDAEPVVLVSLDLVGLLKVWVDRIREAVTETASHRVVVACTHTHSGPDTLGYWGPSILGVFPRSDGKNPNYMRWLVRTVAGCVDDAVRAMRPAHAKLATFEFDAAWCRNDRQRGGAYPATVALQLLDEDGPIGTVVNYASHPEALGEKNRKISSDFVGPLRDALCAAGGELVYFSGPLGAMLTPNVPEGSDAAERERYVDRLGNALATAVQKALADAVELTGELSHQSVDVRLTNSNWRFRLLERLHLVDVQTRGGEVESTVHRVSLGDEFELVTIPGELCPEAGTRLHEELGAEHAMIVCLAEDEFGYVLEPSMFDEPEYRYEISMSLGRDTAPTLLDAIRRIVPVSDASGESPAVE
jgi:hypothetical protein